MFSDALFETSNSKSEVKKIKFVENYLSLENYVTSEGAVSRNVLYYQTLPITRDQVRFYADSKVITNSVHCL